MVVAANKEEDRHLEPVYPGDEIDSEPVLQKPLQTPVETASITQSRRERVLAPEDHGGQEFALAIRLENVAVVSAQPVTLQFELTLRGVRRMNRCQFIQHPRVAGLEGLSDHPIVRDLFLSVAMNELAGTHIGVEKIGGRSTAIAPTRLPQEWPTRNIFLP